MTYKKGLHVICDLVEVSVEKLSAIHEFEELVNGLIKTHQLQATGSVYHSFDNNGYTAVIGLTESHVSVHTWPEFGRVTFDIFLSNFLRVNDGTCLQIAEKIKAHFGGTISQEHILNR
jgi:S-adenosylmethionine decarboxylase